MWNNGRWMLLAINVVAIGLGLVSAAGGRGWLGIRPFAAKRQTSPTPPSLTTRQTNTTGTVSLVSSSANDTAIPAWKQALPDSLVRRKTLQRILIPTSPDTHIELFLLGTAHVSNDSSADVQALLQHVQPDLVFLELCYQRSQMLHDTPKKPAADKDASFWKRVAAVQKQGNMSSKWSALGTVLLTQTQDDFAESLGVELGGEFRAAYKWCRAQQGGRLPFLILGDRPLTITLHRAFESFSWWEKVKVFGSLVVASMKKPNPDQLREWMQGILEGDSDILTESIAEMRKHLPSAERVIIKERDAYMACKIFQTSRTLRPITNYTMVAIVGAGHLPGITSWLTDGNGKSPEQTLTELVQTKKYDSAEVESLVTDVTNLPYWEGEAVQ